MKKRIVVEIECDGEFCGVSCYVRCDYRPYCLKYSKFLRNKGTGQRIVRCQQCLDAEVKEEEPCE